MVSFAASTVSLVIQVVVLVLLASAIVLKIKKKYRQHGITMLVAVVLHIISILAVMVPSFTEFFADPSTVNFASALVIIALVHVASGLIAAALGVFLVGSWHLQTSLQTCFRKKRVMDLALGLWLLAISLGFLLYYAVAQII